MTFVPPTFAPLWLASRSPRRRRMLAEAGVETRVLPAGIDDGRLRPGRVSAAQWVMALAYLKARWVADALAGRAAVAGGTVLAADTVCEHRGTILGQPATADEARAMLRRMRGDVHVTLTGVCLIRRRDRGRWLLVDRARVRFHDVSDAEIERYVEGGRWRGKAGAYNLRDRQDAGWRIDCDGDPDTVMGLPMRRLAAWLARVRNAREAGAAAAPPSDHAR